MWVLSLPFIAVSLLSQTQAISAESASDYAWCVITDGRNCCYTSREQCLESNSGVAFLCVRTRHVARLKRRRRQRHLIHLRQRADVNPAGRSRALVA